jgi:hypothetical protein
MYKEKCYFPSYSIPVMAGLKAPDLRLLVSFIGSFGRQDSRLAEWPDAL